MNSLANTAERDKPLSFHWEALDPAWATALGLPHLPSKAQRARDACLLDTILEAEGLDRWISYSRWSAFYAGKRRYHGTDYTFMTVVPTVDALAAAGLLEHEKARAGSRGRQSRFRAAPPLLVIPPPLVRCDPGELIRLKLRGELVGYRDTICTERMRRNLHAIGEAIDGCELDIDAPGQVRDGHVIRFGGHAVYPRMKPLHRVFNDTWTQGGRIYGVWWQQVKSRDRPHITIDGAATVERDHPELHPRLLYGLAGEPLVDGAYTVDGVPRDLGKVAFNVLVNADTLRSAVGAIANEIGGAGAHAKARDLVDAMKRRHRPIEPPPSADYCRKTLILQEEGGARQGRPP